MASTHELQTSGSLRAGAKNFHWIALGVGVAATGLCGALLLSQPAADHLNLTLETGELNAAIASLSSPHQPQMDGARMLGGVNGETFGAGERLMAAEDLIPNRIGSDIAPVLWNDLADTGCLTVQAKDGRTFSFRISGVRPGTADRSKELPKIELAVEGCTQNGETIAKAYVEPDARRLPKGRMNSEHSL